MKGKRRRSRKRPSSSQPPRPAPPAFTDEEEAFFAAGSAIAEPIPLETFADLEDNHAPAPSWLRRFIERVILLSD